MAIKLPLPPQEGLSTELYSYLYQLSQVINLVADNIDNDVADAQRQMAIGNAAFEMSEEEIAMRVSKMEDGLVAAKSDIKQNADNIEMRVEKSGVIAAINLSPETGATIDADKITLDGNTTIKALRKDVDGKVDSDGVINAINVSEEGITIAANKLALTGDNISLEGNTTIKALRKGVDTNAEDLKDKVDGDKVIAAINVSQEGVAINADKIKLEGYTTINDGFSVDKEGNMTAKGANVSGKVAANEGSVGGWTIIDGKLIATGLVYLNPGMEEVNRVMAHHTGIAEIPAASLQAYDIDNSGEVDYIDAMGLFQCVTGVRSIEDFPRKQLSTVTVEIDPNKPGAPLHIYGTNMWGRNVDSYVSADPSVSSFVSKDLLGGIVQMNLTGGMYRTMEGETEWFNPPMLLGVEYRTTERWNGSAVYTMAVDFGALPNNTEKSKSALAAYLNIFDIRGYAVGGSYNVPIPGYYAIQSMGYTKSNGNLWISTTEDMSGYNAYVVVKYTK